MPLVKAQCTNCNGMLEVDSSKDAAICPHCGTPYIVEKAIQQFNINNTNYIQNATITNESEFQRLLEAGKGFLKLGDNKSALSTFEEMTKKYPQKFESWLGVVCCEVEFKMAVPKGQRVDTKHNSKALENSIKLADTQEKKNKLNNVITRYEEFARKQNEQSVSMFNTVKGDFNDLDEIKHILLSERQRFSAKITEIDYKSISCFKLMLTKIDYVDKKLSDPAKWRLELWTYDTDGDYSGYSIVATSYKPDSGVIVFNDGSTITFVNKNENNEYIVDFILNPDYEHNNILYSMRTGRAILYKELDEQVPNTEGCYIATCVYGSYDCPEVWTLRRFRDNTLASTFAGRTFIKMYYAISPTLVKWFGDTHAFQRFWRGFLDRLVAHLHKKGVEDTQYYD